MTNRPLFDVSTPSILTRYDRPAPPSGTGAERKAVILSDLSDGYKDELTVARDVAEGIARIGGTVAADEVRAALATLRPDITVGPWFGALFRDPRFEPTGERRGSQVVTSNRSEIKVWRLRASR